MAIIQNVDFQAMKILYRNKKIRKMLVAKGRDKPSLDASQ